MDSDFESDATEGDSSSGSSSLAGSPSDGGRRAALYARVSTDEERQTPKTQLFRLREYAGHRGFSIAGEYVDIGSGLDPDRPEYQRLIGDARQRAFDVVIVWRYDRLARSTQALIDALKEFQALGVEFISHQEQIDTTTPQGEMVFGFIASLAQFESRLISQRVKAGMQRAKEEGKDVGRPSIAEEKQKKIRRLYSEEDVSISQVAKQVGVSYGTAWNYVQDIEGD